MVDMEDLTINTKYASIKTKLAQQEIGIVIILIFLIVIVPIYKYMGISDDHLLFFYLFILMLIALFVTNFFQKDPMSLWLDMVYDLDGRLTSVKYLHAKSKKDELRVLEARIQAYEACYFRSHQYGSTSLQGSLKTKIDELKQEASKLQNMSDGEQENISPIFLASTIGRYHREISEDKT
ncbi:MAG: hypothetical protein SCH66_10990 [Methanolobus sp.]|nr:hypothetical protein [Methanolobus sp.]